VGDFRHAPDIDHAFGPYAAAVQRQAPPPPPPQVSNVAPYPAPQQPFRRPHEAAPVAANDVPVADLRGWRQKLEADTDVSVRVANNDTDPATRPDAAPSQVADILPLPSLQARAEPQEASTGIEQPTVKIEAVERRITWRVPTTEASTMPPSLAAMLARTAGEASRAEPHQNAIETSTSTVPVEGEASDDAGVDASWPAFDESDARKIASRLAPPTRS
jgi:hypothetical protein